MNAKREKRTDERSRRDPSPDAAVSSGDGGVRRGKRFAARLPGALRWPHSRTGSQRSAPSLPSISRRARTAADSRPSAGGRASRSRQSTACRSASRTSSKRSTCRPRTARRFSPASAAESRRRQRRGAARGRRRDPRQDGDDRVRRHRAARDPQSVGMPPHAGRLQQRFGCGGRGRDDQRRHRHAGARLDRAARQLLRLLRFQADGRCDQSRRQP